MATVIVSDYECWDRVTEIVLPTQATIATISHCAELWLSSLYSIVGYSLLQCLDIQCPYDHSQQRASLC